MFISSIKKSKTKIVVSILAPILLFFSLLFSSSAYAAVPQTTTQTPPGGPIANEDGTTCAVEKIGWFVCPIVESSAKIGDNMFSFLADNFLQTEPALISNGDGNGTKTAWELARNTANILFIIVFIIVIYSQITSTGLSNYGIKRMMPRLIIVAIAMNLSYLICQLVVDLTNTLGYAIMDWLVSLSHTVFSQSVMPVHTPGTPNTTDVSLLGTIATVAIAGAAVWLLIGPLIGTIGLIVATCIAVVVILLLRKTFIILLVVVSPLAFVAYLLPNTERLFSKWLNMFWKLLLVFPIVAMLMGGGQLASAIILASGHSAGYGQSAAYKAKDEPCVYLDPAMKDEKCEDGEGPGIMLALVAAGVAVAPLLAVFAVMKGALAAAGAIGGKIAQGVQKGSSGSVSGAQKAYKNSTLGKGRAYNKKVREGNIKAGAYTGKNPFNQLRSRANRGLDKVGNSDTALGQKLNNVPLLGTNLKAYGKQRGKNSDIVASERAREKADEYMGSGNYIKEFNDALKEYNAPHLDSAGNPIANQSAQARQNKMDEAKIRMNAARIAAGRSGDTHIAQDMGQSYTNATGAAGGAQGQVAGVPVRAAPQRMPSPMPSSAGGGNGAGTPSSATSGQTSARQANNVAPGAVAPGLGGRSFRQAQAGNLGRADMDDAALISAAKEASRGAANGSTTHEDVGQKIIEEMKSRGIDPTKHI